MIKILITGTARIINSIPRLLTEELKLEPFSLVWPNVNSAANFLSLKPENMPGMVIVDTYGSGRDIADMARQKRVPVVIITATPFATVLNTDIVRYVQANDPDYIVMENIRLAVGDMVNTIKGPRVRKSVPIFTAKA